MRQKQNLRFLLKVRRVFLIRCKNKKENDEHIHKMAQQHVKNHHIGKRKKKDFFNKRMQDKLYWKYGNLMMIDWFVHL